MNMKKFNSQICTTRDQSERLIKLGLKKETADMCWGTITINGEPITFSSEDRWDNVEVTETHFPAWSLHRLIEMISEEIQTDWESMCLQDKVFTKRDNLYDNIVDCIEWLIKEGYFPKEYLED